MNDDEKQALLIDHGLREAELLRKLEQQTDERRRVPGTREGVNGMLDYGYAIMRTAVLRSLAAPFLVCHAMQ